ncbi:MAG: TonB-dependent receptor [Paludibacteraceae bacterium]|nr:TonB-dependent receptor [Paludibacteraceae bacterium]
MKRALPYIIILLSLQCAAQSVTISGVVEDMGGAGPVIGATVLEKGTSNGTITDFDGKFTLTVRQNAQVEISYMGYVTKTLTAKSGKPQKIMLEEDSKQLDEVVVVGYGTMKKRDVTGSITSLAEKTLLENKPINVASALQGKVSGLEIVTASEPGSESNYRIRGASTLSAEGSTPLFIVDGTEVDNIDNINPADIASVEVLKDAASAAIYGSKSANGVIIITTKQGTSSTPVVTAGYSLKIANLARTLPQMNRRQCIDFDILRSYLAGSSGFSVYVNDSLNPSFGDDNFYQDILFRTGLTHQADVSLAGKTDRINYFTSISFMNDDGIALNTWNRRGTARINIDYRPHERVTIGSRISLTIGANRRTPGGARQRILERPANMALIFPDGTYAPVIASRNNPLAWSYICTNNNKYYEANINEFIEWRIIDGLSFKTSIAATFHQNNYRYFEPAILNKNQITASANRNTTSLRWTHDDVLTFTRTFADEHNVGIMAGFSIQGYKSEYINLAVNHNISEAIETSYAFNEVNLNSTYHYQTENRMSSFFARVGYSYKGRYLFNANVRADGSSRFGAKRKWGVFPSGSVGWRLSDEQWMQWAQPVLSDCKIRYSFGMTGNQTAGDYAAMSKYSTIAYADYVGIYPTQLENDQLGWETTMQHNLGVDLSLFNSRLSVIMDLYKKDTRDVLFSMKLPGTTGFSSSYTNIGNISNKGLEFTISGHMIKTRDFDWTASVNFAFNRNKLYNIPEENKSIQNSLYIIDNDYTLGTMYGYHALQIFQYDQSNAFFVDEGGAWHQLTPVFDDKDRFVEYQLDGVKYDGEVRQLRYGTDKGEIFRGGDVMWDDINHDGVINDEDRQVIGCGQPDFTGGFTTEFRWKGLRVSAFFNFSAGGNVINVYEANRNAHIYGTLTQASPVYLAQSWLAPGDVAKYPIPTNARAIVQNTRLNSDLWIQDGSYIRLKNIKVSYTLPKNWLRTLHMQDWTFSVMLQDFFTWTNYDGFDPEIPSSGFAIGYDNNSYPRAKSVLCSMNVTF